VDGREQLTTGKHKYADGFSVSRWQSAPLAVGLTCPRTQQNNWQQNQSTYIGYPDGRARKTGDTKDLPAKFYRHRWPPLANKVLPAKTRTRRWVYADDCNKEPSAVPTDLSSVYPLFLINGFIPYGFFVA
jgi:hypothetical protein